MGEVYRARDTELGREVALKVLPDAVTSDRDRLKRFEREARVLAALSHPNVLTVFDVGHENGRAYLVSERLEGATLDAHLQAGRLSVREALDFGAQIARGLATAHAHGIVHRDLKPLNLFVTTTGVVKILDFGLAHVEPLPSAVSRASTESDLTGPGALLGTLSYMSPEQAKGGAGDTRSDIFSLGVVLFEMLGGRHPFRRESQTETLSAILRDDPPPLGRLKASVPEAVEGLVRRCLAKRPEDRFQTANDLAIALEVLAEGQGKRARLFLPIAAAIGALVATVGLTVWLRLPANRIAPARTPVRFAFDVEQEGVTSALYVGPRGSLEGVITLCPDGTCVVYRGALNGIGRLFLRPLDRLTSTPLPGTERSHGPFFSPDGRWLAFFADGRLRKLLVEKPVAKDVAPVPWGGSGSFGPDGRIYFTSDGAGPISRVSAEGGPVEVVTRLEPTAGETSHRWPLVLPDGQTLIYESRNASGRGRIVAWSLTNGRLTTLVENGFQPRWAGGHLLFYDGTVIKTAPLDLHDVARQSLTRLTPSDGSEGAIWTPDGRRLTYRSSRAGPPNLFSEPADGSGPVERLTKSPLLQFPSSWSLDGRTLSFIEDDGVTSADIRVLSRGESTSRPLVNSAYGEWDGRLSPDGRLVAYASIESGRLEVYVRPFPGPGSKQQVSTDGGNSPVWSRTGKELFYLNGRKMVAAEVGGGFAPTVGRPVVLFEGDYDFAGNVANYDVIPDGEGFVMIRGEEVCRADAQGQVMLNWLDDLERRSPRSR